MKIPCPQCGKKFKHQGLQRHIFWIHQHPKNGTIPIVTEDLRPTPEEHAALTLGVTLRQLRYALKEIHRQVVEKQ